jgi:hypothetical protein
LAKAIAPALVCCRARAGITGGFSPLASRFVPVVGTSAGIVGFGVTEGGAVVCEAVAIGATVDIFGVGSDVHPAAMSRTKPQAAIDRLRTVMSTIMPNPDVTH